MARNDFPKGEFMEFMDSFLKSHPEVVKDQQFGWGIYWYRQAADRIKLASSDIGSSKK